MSELDHLPRGIQAALKRGHYIASVRAMRGGRVVRFCKDGCDPMFYCQCHPIRAGIRTRKQRYTTKDGKSFTSLSDAIVHIESQADLLRLQEKGDRADARVVQGEWYEARL